MTRRSAIVEAIGEALLYHLFLRVLLIVIFAACAALVLARLATAAVPAQAQGYQRVYTRIALTIWPDAPVAALAAQIHQESGWNCAAVSSVGARGCAQFMPATAKWIASFSPSLAKGLVSDPAWAFEAQVRYMQFLVRRTEGDTPCERFGFGASGYNGGEAWVKRRKALSKTPGRCFGATCEINPGITPAAQMENERYSRRIRALETYYATWGKTACELT